MPAHAPAHLGSERGWGRGRGGVGFGNQSCLQEGSCSLHRAAPYDLHLPPGAPELFACSPLTLQLLFLAPAQAWGCA